MNPYRGEVSLIIDGHLHLMRLSLGSLAALETQMNEDSLTSMVERFENGEFKTHDLITLLTAGLRGGGWDGNGDDLLNGEIEGGPLAAARAAGSLLSVTFGSPT
jgi:hypothetical protein